MEDKLRAYMDHLFREVPESKKAVEVKEEILQNLVDKYHDLLAEGKTEEAAYNIAVASIGDVSELLESLKETGPAGSVEHPEYIRWKKSSAIRITIAVMLYIVSILPPIITAEILKSDDSLGACGMFIIIAIATGILVYNHLSKPAYPKMDDTMMEDFKEWKSRSDSDRQALKAIKSALWSIIVVLYFVISFTTMAWYITWVIFLIGASAESIIKAVFDLKK
ncbi:MAG: hypothetical protein J1F02_08520 [Lachnospiraceae bacterium]|nr:hypothetical protein [Lachnospiraceae bacterium]